MRKTAIRIAIRTLMFTSWVIGIGTIHRIQVGEVAQHNMLPCALMAILGMSYFLVNIYRLQSKHAYETRINAFLERSEVMYVPKMKTDASN